MPKKSKNSKRKPSESLHDAVLRGNSAVVNALIKGGASVDEVDSDLERTPLHLAAKHGHAAIASILLANGADVNALDSEGATPLMLAYEVTSAGQPIHTEVATVLLNNGADVNVIVEGDSLLSIALSWDVSVADIHALVERGARIDTNYEVELCRAASTGRAAMVTYMLDAGVRGINDALLAAAGAADINTVALLMGRGADVNYINDKGSHALLLLLDRCHYNEEYWDLLLQVIANTSTDTINIVGDTTPMFVQCLNPNVTTALVLAAGRMAIDSRIALALLDKGADVNRADKAGITPLLSAWRACNFKLATALVQQGADVNAKVEGGRNIVNACDLMYDPPNNVESVHDMRGFLRVLAAKGVNIHVAAAVDGCTLLHTSARTLSTAFVEMLVNELGMDVNAVDKLGQTPLFMCENADLARYLLVSGANVNIVDSSGRTPLMHFIHRAAWGRVATTQELLASLLTVLDEHGAKIDNTVDCDGYTALERVFVQVARSVDLPLDAVKIVLDISEHCHSLPIDLCARDSVPSIIVEACRSVELLQILLEKGVNMFAMRDEKGRSLLHLLYSMCFYTTPVHDLLVTHGDIHAVDCEGQTPLHAAAKSMRCDTDWMTKLVDHGINVDITDTLGMTPLQLAIQNRTPAVQWLIGRGANVNAKSADGSSCLMIAVMNRAYVKDLINNGANVNISRSNVTTLLHLATDADTAVKLMDAGCAVGAVTDRGVSPLMIAASCNLKSTIHRNSTVCVKHINVLIERGADVNAADHDGLTAIMYAARGVIDAHTCYNEPVIQNNCDCRVSIVKALVTAGANVNATDTNGKTALTHAMESKLVVPLNEFVVRALLSMGATTALQPVHACISEAGELTWSSGGDEGGDDDDNAIVRLVKRIEAAAQRFVVSHAENVTSVDGNGDGDGDGGSIGGGKGIADEKYIENDASSTACVTVTKYPGASEAELQAVECLVGRFIPRTIRTLLQYTNGLSVSVDDGSDNGNVSVPSTHDIEEHMHQNDAFRQVYSDHYVFPFGLLDYDMCWRILILDRDDNDKEVSMPVIATVDLESRCWYSNGSLQDELMRMVTEVESIAGSGGASTGVKGKYDEPIFRTKIGANVQTCVTCEIDGDGGSDDDEREIELKKCECRFFDYAICVECLESSLERAWAVS